MDDNKRLHELTAATMATIQKTQALLMSTSATESEALHQGLDQTMSLIGQLVGMIGNLNERVVALEERA